VEAADSGPFFHSNAVETIEGAVAFYNGAAFNNSPSGRVLAGLDPNGIGIRLDATQVVAVAAFLRVLNTLENIRQSLELLEASLQQPTAGKAQEPLRRALRETDDSIQVLEGGGLHPEAVAHLKRAHRLTRKAARSIFFQGKYTRDAIREQTAARALLVES
jgi:hypothetical protein